MMVSNLTQHVHGGDKPYTEPVHDGDLYCELLREDDKPYTELVHDGDKQYAVYVRQTLHSASS